MNPKDRLLSLLVTFVNTVCFVCAVLLFFSSPLPWQWCIIVSILLFFVCKCFGIYIDTKVDITYSNSKKNVWLDEKGFTGLVGSFIILDLSCLWIGLWSMFPEGLWSAIFITAFDLAVNGVLVYIIFVIKIKQQKILIWTLLYLLFDVSSVMIFNFVHFYNNISEKQRMDADITACRMYCEVQNENITKISKFAKDEFIGIRRYDSILEAYNVELKKLDSAIIISNNKLSKIDSTKNKKTNDAIKNLRFKLSKSAEEGIIWNPLRDFLSEYQDSICESLRKIETKCDYYESDSIFGLTDMSDLKAEVIKLQGKLNYFVSNLDEKEKDLNNIRDTYNNNKKGVIKNIKEFVNFDYVRNINVQNDSIVYIMNRMKTQEVGAFTSVKKLVLFLSSLSDNSNNNNGSDSLLVTGETLSPSEPGKDLSPVAQRFVKDDQFFEKQLLTQSILLSIIIDIFPLILSLMSVYQDRRG